MSRSRQCKTKRFSVLIAEDNPETRQAFAAALAEAGFSVTEVRSGGEALRVAREQHPDALVTDLKLPDMDGVELTRTITRDPGTCDIPVVGVSCGPSGDRNRIGLAGFAQVMVDSCGPQHLLADVRGVLGDHPEPQRRRSKRR